MATGGAEDQDSGGYGETSRYAAHLDRGWSLLDRGDLQAARTSAQHAEQLRPDAPDAAVLLGAIALALSDAEESLRWYERAIELDPDYLEPYAAAAQVCLFDLGDPERALHYCNDAVELEHLDPFDTLDLHLLAAECELRMGEDNVASERLQHLAEVDLLQAALEHAENDVTPDDALDEDAASAIAFLRYDADGERLDEDERAEQLSRVLQFGLRLARLWLDLHVTHLALDLLRLLVKRFPNEPDGWYLLSEAESANGESRAACQAALRTYRLDAHLRAPKWAPSPALLHRKVIKVLADTAHSAIRGLVERREPLIVLIHDAPSLELVAEGVDPRAPALALAVHGPREDDDSHDRKASGTPVLTGIAVYRRNLLRLARTPELFDQELRFAVLEELAAFFQLDDSSRSALGLPLLRVTEDEELAAAIEPPEETPPEADDEERPRRRRRRKRMHS